MINLPPDPPADRDRQAESDLIAGAMSDVLQTVADVLPIANDEARSGCLTALRSSRLGI